MTAALRVLSGRGEPADADLARLYLAEEDDSSLVEAAARVLELYGNVNDEMPLFLLSKRLYGESAAAVARACLAVSVDRKERCLSFVRSGGPLPQVGSVGIWEKLFREEELVALLKDDNANARMTVAAYLCDRGLAEKYLDSYLLSGYYFYDVVVMFDRKLHLRGSDGTELS